MKIKPRAILGLGNPSAIYAKTYHNVGFLFVNYYIHKKAGRENLPFKKPLLRNKRFEYVKIGRLAVVKPLIFINESGAAVKSAIDYFGIKPQEILIVQDDSDIELGKWKLSFDRNSAGHRGVQSIIDYLKTKKFWRLRIGIRKKLEANKAPKRVKARELVMKKIANRDLKILEQIFGDIVKLF